MILGFCGWSWCLVVVRGMSGFSMPRGLHLEVWEGVGLGIGGYRYFLVLFWGRVRGYYESFGFRCIGVHPWESVVEWLGYFAIVV